MLYYFRILAFNVFLLLIIIPREKKQIILLATLDYTNSSISNTSTISFQNKEIQHFQGYSTKIRSKAHFKEYIGSSSGGERVLSLHFQ